MPEWLATLEAEDLNFLKNFVLSSGSLKQMAQQYSVSYPTVRLRLDKLIQRIRMAEEAPRDDYVLLIKRLALDERLDFETAKLLIHTYQKEKEER